jgi:hypothetical protein
MEREKSLELSTSTLARLRSTTELFPHCFLQGRHPSLLLLCRALLNPFAYKNVLSFFTPLFRGQLTVVRHRETFFPG